MDCTACFSKFGWTYLHILYVIWVLNLKMPFIGVFCRVVQFIKMTYWSKASQCTCGVGKCSNATDHLFAPHLQVMYHGRGSVGSASQALPGQCKTFHMSGICSFWVEMNSLPNLEKYSECQMKSMFQLYEINVSTIIIHKQF